MSIVPVSTERVVGGGKKKTHPAKKDIDMKCWFEYIAKSVAGNLVFEN
jgi:hypothetical protein